MTSYDPASSGPPSPSGLRSLDAPLTDGPQWYRSRIRGWGALVGLVLPLAIGAVAFASLQLSEAAWSGAVGLIGGVIAAPGLLVVGAPFGDSGLYLIAIALSGVLWMAIGFLAARRATRNPLATWSDYWRHYLWMAVGIGAGACIALGIATISLGEALF